MGEKERCGIFLLALFLVLTPTQNNAQFMDDQWMDQQHNMEHQADPAFNGYMPKHLQAKYGNKLRQGSRDDASGSSEKDDGPNLHSRIFSGGSDASFRKTSYSKTSAGASAQVKTSDRESAVACQGRPTAPHNSTIKCSTYSGCRAKCYAGFEFPNGETTIYITCQFGEWRVVEADTNVIPNCRPVCLPACQNNGICIGPNTCSCPQRYSGPQCQFESRPCLNPPVLPPNSGRRCNSKTCTITCAPGHQFHDGSAIANMVCREGLWVMSRPDWVSIPDCLPVCEPNCQNGGICLAYGMCQCPLEFTGPQCQYRMDACTGKKLAFNGGYSCSGNADTFSCNISCPVGVPFEHPPVALYTCRYETGVFEPSPIPQCVFAANAQIIRHGPTSSFSHSSEFREGYSEYSSQHSAGNSMGFNFSRGGEGQTRNGMGSFGRSGMSGFSDQHTMGFSMPQLTVIEKKPEPGVCYTWGGNHYKSFDGKVFSFDSDCTFTLVKDTVDNTFSVNLVRKDGKKMIKIFSNDKEYTLMLNDVGIPVFEMGARRLAIPSQLSGITTEFIAHYVLATLTGVGVSVMWDAKDFVAVASTEQMWNKTSGLCGLLDGHENNDFTSKTGVIVNGVPAFANSWEVSNLGETCNTTPDDESKCPPSSPLATEAQTFCGKILLEPHLTKCRTLVDAQTYYEACTYDFCRCGETCACATIAVFVRECNRASKGAVAGWRNENTCPMKCANGRVFLPCGPKSQEVCGATALTHPGEPTCEEGCYCPEGTVLDNGGCILKSECSCQLRGKSFKAGDVVTKGCNTCSCLDGQWVCTQVSCSARCSAIGDPHYVTFDGKRFDFMGKCSYYLMEGDDYSVEAENVACAGSVSQGLGMVFNTGENPSCTKAVTIRVGDKTIKLKQNGEVLVDGTEVTKLPVTVADAYIHIVSSIFLMVDMPNGLKVWWDGASRVYIDAPASFQGKTKGLCGTFNTNQQDDFLTPEGDVEQSAVSFANKWKTTEVCDNTDDKVSNHPCDVNVQNKATAERNCLKIKGPLFEKCHWMVNPEPFYQDCRFDLCSCQSKIGECMCPIFAAYAKECAEHGVKIDWRNEVRECGIHCPGGQKYSICGNTCTRSCYDISSRPDCRTQCVEGCNCDEGQTMGRNGDCIPIAQCQCTHSGIEYDAGFREIRPGTKGLEMCTCTNAQWECRPATEVEVLEYPKTQNLKSACNQHKYEMFTQCEPVEPTTCQNMHSPPKSSPAICRPGCVCIKGYVLDSYTKQCIKPTECPCHHGGRSYSEGQSMQEDCNTCSCVSGKWKCTERVCAGVCTAWGDSHFKTFDGKIYDFQGTCDYVLAKGVVSKDDSFDVMIQNVPCSSSGVACSKSVSLKVGSGAKQETITFTRDQPVPIYTGLERITVREAGLFTYAEVFDLGLVLQWDRGTRVYVKIDPKWKNKLKGLCGNYNNNELDDFETPSGGVSEVSPTLFGDSWRLQTYCPETKNIEDTCLVVPGRKLWAMQKCGVLKSEVFERCHSEVPLEPYLERCIFDTCACDLGGDCECLCTAIAAYAQECNIRGIPIKWRTQDLCPIQCDEKCARYSPCVQTCPKQTCDNQFVHSSLTKLCAEDACVEGCEIDPCPQGQVHVNTTSLECVPIASCVTVCMQIGDVSYFEGDKMEEDECHTCFCSHHKKTCTGVPCPPTTVIPPTLPNTARLEGCKSGWTSWFNSYEGKGYSDDEPIPTMLQMHNANSPALCDVKDMSGISCRVVGTHEAATDVGENVVCSLNGGLACKGKCHDFEIRVLCECEPSTTLPPPREVCNTAVPNKEHPEDCHKFLECVDTLDGPNTVEKTCGAHMMYNPETYTCDWPATVALIKPHCGVVVTTTTTAKPTEAPATCSEGWSEWMDTPANPDGDYELLDTFERLRSIPCRREDITDIQCKFQKLVPIKASKGGVKGGVKGGSSKKRVLMDYTESNDHVTCSPTTGLSCIASQQSDGKCEDYRIRVFCQCHPTSTVKPTTVAPVLVCPPGQVWDECAILCTQVCHFYDFYLKKTGACKPDRPCVAGCKDSSVGRCPTGSFWRDQHSCVRVNDCTCRSDTGEIVKPGQVHQVSECEACQCIDNEYICDTSACDEEQSRSQYEGEDKGIEDSYVPVEVEKAEVAEVEDVRGHNSKERGRSQYEGQDVDVAYPIITEAPVLIIPHLCEDDMYRYEVETLPVGALTASSALSAQFEPENARLNAKQAGGSWVPKVMDERQFLQVDLGRVEPVYGVVVQGSPLAEDYVTTYNVLTAREGEEFRPVLDHSQQPMIFKGPTNGNTPAKEMLVTPVEARFVRFVPLTYHGAIAMRVEVIGCGPPVTTEIPYEPTTTPAPIIVVPTTVTPPELCEDDLFTYEVETLSPDALTASSVYSPLHSPHNARLNSKLTPWTPKVMDRDQYLQVDLGRVEPVYGVVVQGSPLAEEYVTSYMALVGTDGERYAYVTDAGGQPAVFRGPIDGATPVKQLFAAPVEARFVRFNPLTFHKAIAMRVEVIGCGHGVTTELPFIASTVAPPALCDDKMGLENGMMSDQQISASSALDGDENKYGPRHVRPGDSGWVADSRPKQWIMFDFLEPRNITGVTTLGTDKGWVEAYKVMYSHDDKAWNPIVDDNFAEKVFLANFDAETPSVNMFDWPIQAQYLKVIPTKWHEKIALKAEVLGCFHPYPEVTTPAVVEEATPPLPEACKLCPGQANSLIEMVGEHCACGDRKLWDGENCVPATECPCYVGHIPYAVGTVYESEDCQQCVCKVGGASECSEKRCDACDEGLQSVKTATCGCVCKPCEEGTVFCKTSNICIDQAFWCDGIKHCPDDEVDCVVVTEEPTTLPTLPPTTTVLPTTVEQGADTTVLQETRETRYFVDDWGEEFTGLSGFTPQPQQYELEIEISKSCPTLSCPKGFVPIARKKTELELLEAAEQSALYGTKGGKTKTGVKGGVAKGRRPLPAKLIAAPEESCPRYECMSSKKKMTEAQVVEQEIPCPTAECQTGFKLVFVQAVKTKTRERCPKFKCEPLVPEAVCNVTERNFRTFDGTEYKYDICNHVIAQDLNELQKWKIDMSKECSVFTCKKTVTITQDGMQIQLLPDLTVKYGDYVYTVDQARKIGDLDNALQVSRTGDVLVVQSEVYGYWLTWDPLNNLRVVVPGDLINHVEGLCGFFSGQPEDDKRKPNTQLARTSVEFGDSWANGERPENCEPLRCPIHVQNEALQLCYAVKEKPFSRCQGLMNVDRFVSNCLESACSCLSASNETEPEACRCKLLLNFVTECEADHPSVDLSTWRVDHNCPVDCADTFKDCYRRPCELSCDRLMEDDPCPVMEGSCFPGCFCADGLVRKGDTCVKPIECRDCVCESFGDPQYLSFDRTNFTFNGNCTYVASQDISPNGDHEYQVLETNGKCHDKPDSTCTESVTVVYKGHTIHVRREQDENELVALVDGERIQEFPLSNKWLLLQTIPNKEVAFLIRPIQLEVTFFFHNYAFVLRLPSKLYGGRTEGLCGNCNKDKSDDLRMRDGELTEDVNEFGLSWLEKGKGEEYCSTPVELKKCEPIPPHLDPCLKIMDPARFGKCHAVVDPVPYLSACQLDICHSNDTMVSACRDLEAYARDCLREGLCNDWRSDDLCPYPCGPDLEYRACGLGCQETCENYELFRDDPSACSLSPGDGCFCPEGMVLRNGTCAEVKFCSPCDDQGHYVGDRWTPDKCTTCACEGTTKSCTTTNCAALETLCEVGMMAIEQTGYEEECCPKYLCVPMPTVGPTCPEPLLPECGNGQVLKMEQTPNGCTSFICECKPVEECEGYHLEPVEPELSAPVEEPLLEGFVKTVNTSGCCPRVEIVCHPELCPQPDKCRQHYDLVTMPVVKDACCPEYACELPKNVCLYEFEHKIDSSGDEISRKPEEKYMAVKEPGSTWMDGPCHECTCTGSRPGEYRALCSVETCPDLLTVPDALSYVLTPVSVPDKCCPNVKRAGCIVNGTTMEVGSKLPGGPCEMYACIEIGDEVQIEKAVEKCNTNCQLGEEYEKASEESGECCGACRLVECVVNGEVHQVGSTWQSDDHCVNYFCKSANGSVYVQTVKTSCPKVPDDLLEQFRVEYETIAGECCKRPVKVACKVDGTEYAPGDSWSHPTDRCKNVSCVAVTAGDLGRQELTQTCNTDCDLGWEYVPSPEHSSECCGKCTQYACLVDGAPYKKGTTWHSEDNCTTFHCNDEFQMNIMTAQCPPVDDCDPEKVYVDGCCKRCKIKAASLSTCVAESLSEKATVGLIREATDRHGMCTNRHSIKNFHECSGSCHSSTHYDSVSATHENKCDCCQATEMIQLSVILHCEDGYSLRKMISVPKDCGCEACSAEAKSNVMKIPHYSSKGGTKTSAAKGGRKGSGYDSDIYRFMKQGH